MRPAAVHERCRSTPASWTGRPSSRSRSGRCYLQAKSRQPQMHSARPSLAFLADASGKGRRQILSPVQVLSSRCSPKL